jgi:hemerythrin-like domain-containing protein
MAPAARAPTILDMTIQKKNMPASQPANRATAADCGCAGGVGHPVDELTREHQTILLVLGAMERELRPLQDGAPIRRVFWGSVLEFLEHYADRCHHGKEEQLLFLELERAGVPAEHGPTACMRKEHELGRTGRRRMVEAVQDGRGAELARAAGGYVELLREHIGKEDQVLFPMAKSVLDQAAVERLRRGFAAVEQRDLGVGSHALYEQLARELAAGGARPTPS